MSKNDFNSENSEKLKLNFLQVKPTIIQLKINPLMSFAEIEDFNYIHLRGTLKQKNSSTLEELLRNIIQ